MAAAAPRCPSVSPSTRNSQSTAASAKGATVKTGTKRQQPAASSQQPTASSNVSYLAASLPKRKYPKQQQQQQQQQRQQQRLSSAPTPSQGSDKCKSEVNSTIPISIASSASLSRVSLVSRSARHRVALRPTLGLRAASSPIRFAVCHSRIYSPLPKCGQVTREWSCEFECEFGYEYECECECESESQCERAEYLMDMSAV
ncbi:hypothetical protein AWZ03_010871 [Drosophila navojoa]|uniref:Uncharacterized protein n=1 Tax=Drosophila navojoa TaxID=7232 RepID=A0A484B4G5_DRONA|nr:hypothetical protein AWZ03_010871 [Drosophila navojoa]